MSLCLGFVFCADCSMFVGCVTHWSQRKHIAGCAVTDQGALPMTFVKPQRSDYQNCVLANFVRLGLNWTINHKDTLL